MIVRVGELEFRVEQWLPGKPVLVDRHLAIDTETHLIIEGQTPPIVLLQVCSYAQRVVQWVWWSHVPEYKKQMFAANPNTEWIFHNAPFDLRVLGGVRDTPEWMAAAVSKRIVDTGMRYRLRQMLLGKSLEQWGLATVAKQLLKIELDKCEDIRLTFRQDMVLTDRHIIYAVADAIVTAQLREVMPNALPTEEIHVWGHIALDQIGLDGMLVDPVEMEEKRTYFQNKYDSLIGTLNLFGWHKGRKGNKSVLQGILSDIEERTGAKLPRTPKSKELQLNENTEQIIYNTVGRDHPFVKNYREADHCHKMIGTYMNKSLIHEDGRVHPKFDPLKKTGRTSCVKPNIQNLPRDEGLRGMYVAPPGKVILATDYSQAELCSLAETCYLNFGKSKMRELINEGLDLHEWFGEILMKHSGGNKEDGVDYRKMAKPANFGLPGGLGPPTFQQFSKGYGIHFELEQCAEIKDLWKDAFPEMEYHLSPQEDPDFTIVREVMDEEGNVTKKRESAYIARTVNGRVRRNATYCSACNYSFQGLVADGAKIALWYLYRAGFKVVNFIHDEVLVELDIDEHLQDNIKLVELLMVKGMERVIKHVTIRVESTLSRRWYKEAKTVYDKDNNLIIWEPTT